MAPALLPAPPSLSLGADLIHLRFINRLKKKKKAAATTLCFFRGLGKLGGGTRLQVPSGGLNSPSSPDHRLFGFFLHSPKREGRRGAGDSGWAVSWVWGKFDGYQACAAPQPVPCPKAESALRKKKKKRTPYGGFTLADPKTRDVEGSGRGERDCRADHRSEGLDLEIPT